MSDCLFLRIKIENKPDILSHIIFLKIGLNAQEDKLFYQHKLYNLS